MCSAISQFPGLFLLLDIGNPTTPTCIETIRKALLNILSLASHVKGTSRIPVFGCGILEPNMTILHEWNFLKGNYIEIQKKLENIEKSLNVGLKCTMRDYKHCLDASILKIVSDFEFKRNNWKLKSTVKEQLNPKLYWPTKIIITLITKKAALPIQKMLEHVSVCSKKLEKIEIVEISGVSDHLPEFVPNLSSISCSIVSENTCDLDAFFKTWILNSDKFECEILQIVLDKKSVHHIQCDVGCSIDLENMTISEGFVQTGFFQTSIPYNYFISKGIKYSTFKMNVINKLKISDVCSSKLFGLPKIIYATRSHNLSVAELQFNNQLFKALCAQLFKEQIGLLTKIGPDFNEITSFYFITSDGEKLFIRNVIPTELQLPLRPKSPKTLNPDNEDANFVVHSLLDRIETAQEISPDKCSSGIYEHLKKLLKSEEVDLKETFDQFQNEKCRRIKEVTSAKTSLSPVEYTSKFLKDSNFSDKKFFHSQNIKKVRKDSGNYAKRKKFSGDVIHPALLPPEVAARYRRLNAHKFLLPELLEPGVLEK